MWGRAKVSLSGWAKAREKALESERLWVRAIEKDSVSKSEEPVVTVLAQTKAILGSDSVVSLAFLKGLELRPDLLMGSASGLNSVAG